MSWCQGCSPQAVALMRVRISWVCVCDQNTDAGGQDVSLTWGIRALLYSSVRVGSKGYISVNLHVLPKDGPF